MGKCFRNADFEAFQCPLFTDLHLGASSEVDGGNIRPRTCITRELNELMSVNRK
jgi:hypothetical protein